MIEHGNPKRVILNFSNPYILQSMILPQLVDLKSRHDIHITIITSNYFEPSDLEESLRQYRQKEKIAGYKILPLYSDWQMPKGRPLQKYLSNILNFIAIKRIYLVTKPDLCLFHTTNELSDLIGIGFAKTNGIPIGILRPTSCEPPSELHRRSGPRNYSKLLTLSIRKGIYLSEMVSKILIYSILMKTIKIKPARMKGFHSDEISDFALCSNMHDAKLLSHQLHTKVIDVVNFAPTPIEKNVGLAGMSLILLPFLENDDSGASILIDKKLNKFIRSAEPGKTIYLKHHPRTPRQIATNFNQEFSQIYNCDNQALPSLNLNELMNLAETIVSLNETSAGLLAYSLHPTKTYFIPEKDLGEDSLPQTQKTSTLLDYLMNYLAGKVR